MLAPIGFKIITGLNIEQPEIRAVLSFAAGAEFRKHNLLCGEINAFRKI